MEWGNEAMGQWNWRNCGNCIASLPNAAIPLPHCLIASLPHLNVTSWIIAATFPSMYCKEHL